MMICSLFARAPFRTKALYSKLSAEEDHTFHERLASLNNALVLRSLWMQRTAQDLVGRGDVVFHDKCSDCRNVAIFNIRVPS